MKAKLFIGIVAALLLVVVLVTGMGSQAQAQERAPAVTKQSTYLLYPATALTGNGTVYSASPRNVATGLDASKVNGWANVDVFVTLDVATSGWFTTTLQYSADAVNWADADYEYATDSTIATKTHVRYMTADGTELIRAVNAGEYMRVKIEHSADVTPTVYTTYRN